jgi:AraC-like DNA-binding protein
MTLLRDLRMHLAASLLTQSDLPVKRIAELAGFQSRSAFTRTFESATGLSPRSFRAEAKDK